MVANHTDEWKFRATDHGEQLAGCFITIEGIDGGGKSSAAKRLELWLRGLGKQVVLTREPGGTAVGEEIRGLLFGAVADKMVVETEALLFAAARSQLVSEVIQPALWGRHRDQRSLCRFFTRLPVGRPRSRTS